MERDARPTPRITVVHSSDLHLVSGGRGDDLGRLRAVAAATRAVSADILLLAGDIFDHNRLPLSLVDAASRLLGDLRAHVVILPGNHDCLAPGSVYRRGGIAEVPNVDVFGLSVDQRLCVDSLDLEIWGRPHLDHVDMSPLAGAGPRRKRFQVSVAHGHWVTGPHDHHRSWLIRDEEIAALDSDYLALGHWDRAVQLHASPVPAYYSGSPDLARSVNVVRLGEEGLSVVRLALSAEREPSLPDL
jgi:DNA repair exonuclease SbcCD nuclease subunit